MLADEPLWGAEERGVERGLAGGVNCFGLSEVDLVGCHQSDACMQIAAAL